ncbi:hypothetical protein HD597_004194 [Nonomuraea thailandensis]|uniref:Uncharacterized protein n=1 Tax=Nonomuraea thailandensis TaxID=1188745 RepID=A0A9X2K2A1_9ACTN|nr:hypothetical protein [Nonomuraea thailandensis]MCP2357174.1 hypothetical protein [Nonomuraea thailandensis]
MRSIVTPGPRVRAMMARSRRADLTALARHVDREAVRPIAGDVHPLETSARLTNWLGPGVHAASG